MLKLTMTCSVITELIMNYETVYATLDLKRFREFLLQFEDLKQDLKVILTVTYGNRVVYVHREKNIYVFNLLDYI